MSTLFSLLAGWKPFSALVVGDFMLDQMVYGDADRLSPDAPVPVLAVKRTENRPGGAANVCLNLAAMHARVTAFGLVGADAEAGLLREALASAGVDPSGLLTDSARPTTLKRSLIGLAQHRHPQKMFRMDMESRAAIDDARVGELLRAFERALPGADVVCIEDYDKGVCSARLCAGVIDAARRAGKPVLVDPAAIADYSKYARASAVTPNRSEAELAVAGPEGASGRAPSADTPAAWEELAARLLAAHGFDSVVLTLDRHGALLALRGEPPAHFPTVARTVYDVSGAGDMVLAALAGALANGASWPDSVRLANIAAGLEVEVFGVEPIPFERIHHSALMHEGRLAGKTRSLDDLLIEIAAHRRQGRTIVFANGCFDLLHAGHVALLRHAARQGDVLVVGLNDDESVRRLKGAGRPVHSQRDRADILGELESVSAVALFSEDTPMRLIESIRPDVLVKGSEYARPGKPVVGREFVESYGGRVELAPHLEGRSATNVITRVRGDGPRTPLAQPTGA